LFITDRHKDAVVMYERLMEYLVKDCGLDLSKFIRFGSDGAATMVGKKNGVSIKLKTLNLFLTSLSLCGLQNEFGSLRGC